MLSVRMDETTALTLLCDRVKVWRDGEVADLFCRMYENHIDNGVFNGWEFDPMVIVDNDVVNWCSVVEKGEKDFDTLLSLYREGNRSIPAGALEEYNASFIEAVNDDETMILIRY